MVLALEPLNDRVDHPGYYLTSTVEGLDIIDEVDRPEVRLLYDIYHSAMMGEHIEDVLEGRLDRVAHVHLADTQGRGEPGSGDMDWQSAARLAGRAWLFGAWSGSNTGRARHARSLELSRLAFAKRRRSYVAIRVSLGPAAAISNGERARKRPRRR